MIVKSFDINFESNFSQANVKASITGKVSKDVLVKMFSDVLSNSLYYAFNSKKMDSEICINLNLSPILDE